MVLLKSETTSVSVARPITARSGIRGLRIATPIAFKNTARTITRK
jgi:hypothetical protein